MEGSPQRSTGSARDGPDAPARVSRPVGDRWAVIVGVTAYADKSLNLKWARRDAEAVRDFLFSPAGGAFPEQQVRVLLDEQATTRNVRIALDGFLAATGPDDFVVIYFACHGAHDSRGKQARAFFLSYDTDPQEIAGTAYPMDDLDRCLDERVRAERVVVLTDACYSAAVSGGRALDDGHVILQHYLEGLGGSGAGRAVLTSSRAMEKALEDESWGAGHGVFTHFLLEGLSGKADGYKSGKHDGRVGVGELYEYVREKVAKATQNRQVPHLGPQAFDQDLPLAYLGDAEAKRSLELAEALLDTAWLDEDPGTFLLADEAARQAAALVSDHVHDDAIARCRGESMLAAGNAARALELLPTASHDAMTNLLRGLASARVGDRAAAARHLERAATADPEGLLAAWSRRRAGELAQPHALHCLLVGISQIESYPVLPGVGADVDALEGALKAIGADDVSFLRDEAATREAVLAQLGRLAHTPKGEPVFFHFGGMGQDSEDPDAVYLLTADPVADQGYSGITARELADWVRSLGDRGRLVVLDTTSSSALFRQEGVSGVLCVGTAGSQAYELAIGPAGAIRGVLAYGLEQSVPLLAEDSEATLGQLLAAVRTTIGNVVASGGSGTDPVMLGDRWRRIVGRPCLDLWRLTRSRSSIPEPTAADGVDESDGPAAQWVRGRMALAAGDVARSTQLLESAAPRVGAADRRVWLDLARARLTAGEFSAASAAAAQLASGEGVATHDAAAAHQALERLSLENWSVLAIGVERFAAPDVPAAPGASADAHALAALASRYGVTPEAVVTLADEGATTGRILSELDRLAENGTTKSVLLYFAGHGSRDRHDERPTILAHDSRVGRPDLSLDEVVERVQSASDNLVVILDAGWDESDSWAMGPDSSGSLVRLYGKSVDGGYRFVPPFLDVDSPTARDVAYSDDAMERRAIPQMGAVLVTGQGRWSLRAATPQTPAVHRGMLTEAIELALTRSAPQAAPPRRPSYVRLAELANAVRPACGARARGPGAATPFL